MDDKGMEKELDVIGNRCWFMYYIKSIDMQSICIKNKNHKGDFVMRKIVILTTLLLGLCISVFAEEAPNKLEVGDYLNISYFDDGSWRTPHLRAVNMNFNKIVQVQRIEPAATGLCRVTYSTGLTEYIKKGDVFYYRPEKSAPGVGSYMCIVDSFDYNKISFRIEESSLTAIHFENKD